MVLHARARLLCLSHSLALHGRQAFGNVTHLKYRNDVVCAKIASVTGRVLPWVSETRYLGVYIANSKSFKCFIDAAKRAFYCSANAMFGKIGRIASEEVTLQLIRRSLNVSHCFCMV